MEEVTLPAPPEGYIYKLASIVKKPKPSIRYKDPSELTPRQKATLKYQQKNAEKLKNMLRITDRKKRGRKSIKSLSISVLPLFNFYLFIDGKFSILSTFF